MKYFFFPVVLGLFGLIGCSTWFELPKLSILPHQIPPFTTPKVAEDLVGGSPAWSEVKNEKGYDFLIQHYEDRYYSDTSWNGSNGIFSYDLYFRKLTSKSRLDRGLEPKYEWRLVGCAFTEGVNGESGDREYFLRTEECKRAGFAVPTK